MTKKIYIAGPMTGYDGENKEAFFNAESRLNEEGYTVLNPAILPGGLTQDEYMSIDLQMLFCCDAIYLLEGWQLSAGATTEYSLATKLKKEIVFEVPPAQALNSRGSKEAA